MNKLNVVLALLLVSAIVIPRQNIPVNAQEHQPIIVQLKDIGDLSLVGQDVDAVVVNQDDLTSQKLTLVELAKTKVILFKGYINDLTDGLQPVLEEHVGKSIPRMRTERTIPVVSGLTIRNGTLVLGSQYIEKDRVITEKDVQAMMETYTKNILSTAIEYAGNIPTVSNPVRSTYTYMIALPLIAKSPGMWDPWPVLINEIDYCPQGQYVDVMNTKKGNENNPDYDWWATQINQQMIPGIVGCNGSNWTSSRIHNSVVPQNWGQVFDYDPTTVAGDPNTPVNLSIGAGLANTLIDLVWNWFFSTENISVLDYSSYIDNKIEHEFIFHGAQERTTNQTKPGLAVQQGENSRPLYYRPMNIYYWMDPWDEFPHFDAWWVQY